MWATCLVLYQKGVRLFTCPLREVEFGDPRAGVLLLRSRHCGIVLLLHGLRHPSIGGLELHDQGGLHFGAAGGTPVLPTATLTLGFQRMRVADERLGGQVWSA